ncbi:class I SAM-dependent methyltransferase, partial [Methylopila musalis]
DRGAECVAASRALTLLPKVLAEGSSSRAPFGAATLAHLGAAAPLVSDAVAALARLIRAHVAAAPADRPLRILEIAAGSGALTRAIADLGEDPRVTLTVSDPDATAAERLRFAFAGRPGLSVTAFDPSAEDEAPGPFDLVVGALGWGHALSGPDALRRLGTTLGDGGALMLAALAPQPLLDVTFGLEPGWFERSASDEFPVGVARDASDWAHDLGDARLADHVVAPLDGVRAP